jgi:hypothetical protein
MQLESTALLPWEEEQQRYKETSMNLLESSLSELLFHSPHQEGKNQQLLQRSSVKLCWWLLSISAEVIAMQT